MAEWKVSTDSPGVSRYDFVSGYHLRGTKERLLSAGLAQPSWFVDGLERDKRGRVRRSVSGMFEGKSFQCTHDARSNSYHLVFRYTGEELEARERDRALERAQHAQLEEARTAGQQRVAALPSSHAAYRAQMTRMGEQIAMELRTLGGVGIGGYRYSGKAMDQVERALDALAEALELGETLAKADSEARGFKDWRRYAVVYCND